MRSLPAAPLLPARGGGDHRATLRQWKRTTRGHFLALSIVSSRFVHAVACRRLFLSHGRVGPRRVNGPRFAYPVTHPCRTPGRFRPPRRSARGNSSI